MVKMRAIRDTKYQTRRLMAGDEFEATPKDAKIYEAIKHAEVLPDVPPAPRRGRPPKAAAPDPQAEAVAEPEPEAEHGPTHAELVARAEALGLELPAGYVRNDVLASMIEDAEKPAGGGGR